MYITLTQALFVPLKSPVTWWMLKVALARKLHNINMNCGVCAT